MNENFESKVNRPFPKIARYFMFYAQSAMQGHIRVKQNVFLQVKINYDSLFNTHSTGDDWKNVEKMKVNEPGRQKLGIGRSPVSRQSMQSYILTYCRL